MFTKSRIQQITESISVKNNFKEGLENLMEKYNVADSIFVSLNNQVQEVTRGYFAITNEYDTIQEAIQNCDMRTEGIRIINNKRFQTGQVCGILSACPKDKEILDIQVR